MTAPPIEHFYDLSDLSNAGDEVVVSANPDACRRIADWLDVEAVEKFAGTVTLRRIGAHRYGYAARLDCDVVQQSVVSLKPLSIHIGHEFARELHVVHRARREPGREAVELTLAAGEDEAPEELDSPNFDLAAPLLEELSLSLDPYPRGANEVFAASDGAVAKPESPFAILKQLKKDG